MLTCSSVALILAICRGRTVPGAIRPCRTGYHLCVKHNTHSKANGSIHILDSTLPALTILAVVSHITELQVAWGGREKAAKDTSNYFSLSLPTCTRGAQKINTHYAPRARIAGGIGIGEVDMSVERLRRLEQHRQHGEHCFPATSNSLPSPECSI